jgi:hypothetical protein
VIFNGAGINVKKRHQLAGVFLLISAIAGYVFLFVGFIIPGILLIIGGILALISKENLSETEDQLGDH